METIYYMGFRIYLFLFVFISFYDYSTAQDIHVQVGSDVQSADCAGTILPAYIQEDWKISLRNFSTFHHSNDIPREEYIRIKHTANLRESRGNSALQKPSGKIISSPVLNANFQGNLRDSGIPLDNTIAVSRNGFVVSSINSNVLFALPDGTITFKRGLADFFSVLALGNRMFDPRVIYDTEANRFILVCLHGSEPGNSYLCIAFSKTEDPNGEWNFYKIKGDVFKDDVWFDFPNLGLSKEDLYIGGNMFTAENRFAYSMLVQISKSEGYQGGEIQYKAYDRVKAANSQVFNVLPVLSGEAALHGPGLYFINYRGDNCNVLYTDKALKDGPVLKSYTVKGPRLLFPADARQKGSTTLLNTGDNRMQYALLQNGIIHFVTHTNTNYGDVGIFYGRLDLNSGKINVDILTDIERDLAYPSITPFGTSEEGDVFLINYTYGSLNEFPGQAVRTVSGEGDIFNWSEEVITKEGQSPITSGEASIRWGDYTCASTRYVDGRTEAWVAGTYGQSAGHFTWLGQYLNSESTLKPILECKANPTSTQADSLVRFYDISSDLPLSREWYFPGGTPAYSTDSVPVVTYADNGQYDVVMINHYKERSDTLTKPQYINIYTPESLPVAEFTCDRDTIFIGESVHFKSLSSPNTNGHSWTFVNGIPNFSTEKNPVVNYKKKGSFIVSLTARNIAGTHNIVKKNYITVLEKPLPIPGFLADQTVILEGDTIAFTNTTQKGKAYRWIFEGGTPNTSEEFEPKVVYESKGSFDVKLIVSNDYGSDSLLLEDYITVGVVSTEEVSPITTATVYPNPAQSIVNIDFVTTETGIYKISLYNQQGIEIKTLYNDRVKKGRNILSFNSEMLPAGIYFIVLGHHSSKLKSMKLQVVK